MEISVTLRRRVRYEGMYTDGIYSHGYVTYPIGA